jgi:hypothetical protein
MYENKLSDVLTLTTFLQEKDYYKKWWYKSSIELIIKFKFNLSRRIYSFS